MPDKRKHRGPNPEDEKIFSSEHIPMLRAAVTDLSFLLSRGYSKNSASILVGQRYLLSVRQRMAVYRSSFSDEEVASIKRNEVAANKIHGSSVAVDGYNLLIAVESYLSGAYLFLGRDKCYRDIAGIHGSYRKVEETVPALQLIHQFLHQYNPSEVFWLFDSPVSNSGRLKVILQDYALQNGLPWKVELSNNPDKILIDLPYPVITTDSIILIQANAWFNFTQILFSTLDRTNKPLIDLS